MDMTIVRCLKSVCGVATLAGAMAVLPVPAKAQSAAFAQLAASTKAGAVAQSKTIHNNKSVPPRKKSRCHG